MKGNVLGSSDSKSRSGYLVFESLKNPRHTDVTQILGDKLTQTVKDFHQRSKLVSIQKPISGQRSRTKTFAEKIHEARKDVISTFDKFSG